MSFVRHWPVLLLGIAVAAPAYAAERFTGRWALDPAECSGFSFVANQGPLVVTDYAVRWHADSCRIARMYKTGDTVHIEAQCWGARGERSIPVSMRPNGGRLELRWDRVRSGALKRCE